MIAFTVDIDWVPEEIIADTLQLFEQYEVKCTFFATHNSPLLQQCNRRLFEIGIHPNFNPLLAGDFSRTTDQILDELIGFYPEAKGIRSHSLFQNGYLFLAFQRRGLLYESNMFLPYHPHLKPFLNWHQMVTIPFNWEDDMHWYFGYTFDQLHFTLNPDQLQVFNFHPIHIYLNTCNQAYYEKCKYAYQHPEELSKLVNQDSAGVRDALIYLLEQVHKYQYPTYTLSEIAQTIYKYA